MIDLSIFNSTPSFAMVREHGTKRVYLRCSQGAHEHDPTFPIYRRHAQREKLRVGAYHVVWPSLHTTEQELANIVSLRRELHLLNERPMLDCETGLPSPRVGRWIMELSDRLFAWTKIRFGIYGSRWYLSACEFSPVFAARSPLWYATLNGREYDVPRLPAPWKSVAAVQWTSRAQIPGIHGFTDRSLVYRPDELDLHRHLFGA